MLKALFDCGADWGAEMDHFGNSIITEAQRRCVRVDPCTAMIQSCRLWCARFGFSPICVSSIIFILL